MVATRRDRHPAHAAARPGGNAERNAFLDGTESTALLERIKQCAARPQPLPADAERVPTRLRQGRHLLTPDEELVHAQAMGARHATAPEAMTRSCDLYREAASRRRPPPPGDRRRRHDPRRRSVTPESGACADGALIPENMRLRFAPADNFAVIR
ncbi:hypothetical protein [Streptomyces sp. CA-179760]|uniref:hypothetical protein n=1 Tax=Streptomyces sp. CA-179760 TaxID=3240054 RepID=UPI003D93789E